MYTEPQMLETVQRLIRIYLESYPNDLEGLARFQQWLLTQYGYNHGKS
jgi:hypothetical protein